MIIQIRGTSGSGKTTVMRKVMAQIGPWEPEYQTKGRKKPLLYTNRQGVRVLGHYESACGGCDTIGSAGKVYDLIQTLKYRGFPTLCEGLLLSEDTKWTLQLDDVRALFLTTSLETCLAQIKSRRAEAGNEKELNVKNTSNRVAVIERARVKLNAAGIITRRASSDQAVGIILNWLGCTPTGK